MSRFVEVFRNISIATSAAAICLGALSAAASADTLLSTQLIKFNDIIMGEIVTYNIVLQIDDIKADLVGGKVLKHYKVLCNMRPVRSAADTIIVSNLFSIADASGNIIDTVHGDNQYIYKGQVAACNDDNGDRVDTTAQAVSVKLQDSVSYIYHHDLTALTPTP